MDVGKIRAEIIRTVKTSGISGIARWSIDVFNPDNTRSVSFTKDEDEDIDEIVFDPLRPHLSSPALRCMETYTISVVPRFSGYLSLFNLGTSGAIGKMFPENSSIDNHVTAGVEFQVTNCVSSPGWRETGPLTADTGNTEGFLVVLSDNPRPVHTSDLHIDLVADTGWGMTRGSLGKDSDGIAELYGQTGVHLDFMEFNVVQ
jgi:hypothetical protein